MGKGETRNNMFQEVHSFTDVHFEYSILNEDYEVFDDIVLTNCLFKEKVLFDKVRADQLSFNNCTFEGDLEISACLFLSVDFFNCTFLNDVKVDSRRYPSTISFNLTSGTNLEISGNCKGLKFTSSTFDSTLLKHYNIEYAHSDSTIEFLSDNKIRNLKFKSNSCFSNFIFKGGEYDTIHFYGTFNNRVTFEEKIINNHLFFESCIFKNRLDFKEGLFDYISLNRSSFYELVYFNGFDIVDFKPRDIKIRELSINSSFFDKGVSITSQDLQELRLSSNIFKEIFTYNRYDSKRESDLPIEDLHLSISGSSQGNIIIEDAYIDINLSDINLGNIYFKNISIFLLFLGDFHNKGCVSFIDIKKGDYLVIQNSVVGELNFLNEDINSFREIVISNSNLLGLILTTYPLRITSYSSNPKIGFGLDDKSKDDQNLKSVYNQFKQIAKKNGDIDTMNRFKSLEHEKMLRLKGVGFDSILLSLNWLSNNHGQSWVRGVFFTLITAMLLFKLYLESVGEFIVSHDFLKDYVQFITSYPKLELEKYDGFNSNWNTSLVIWFARIIFSYGIYQTVSSFRKYGKE